MTQELNKPWTDETWFHYGNKHRNKKLKDVPASYLLFIYNEEYTMPPQLKAYIVDNLQVLKKQELEEKKEAYRNWRNSAR